ncbi:Site-specific DNA recombinase [Promicromonospora umidemergens]|uniref:Recombinase family protein n=1 Tax=Promicromonospora umidemergens TaxID=629679 RepID=A0ABP8XV67_9MICO|nr:recombinase family protein [Promicromonospora umidemergens]MCP2286016.1 Site-specific DNA recombinase [Promicromonospora umidemergens]
MTLIGLVRVTGDARDADRQHELLDPICARVFEEEASRRRLIKNRPQLLAALDHLRPGDMLVVTRAKHLAQSMLEGLNVLNDLFEQGVAVKVLEGIAAGDHTKRSLFLDQGRDIAELRRRLLSQRIKTGLQAARERGDVGGRPTVVNDVRRAGILSLRNQGEPIRAIALAVGVSVGTVHNVLTREE